MQQYLDALSHVLEHGHKKGDRTGTGTLDTFGYQMRFDLGEGFPLLTTKRVPFAMIVHELLWFLKGDTNIKYLVDNDVHIWNEWPYKAYLQKQRLPVPKSNSDEWKLGIKKFVDDIKTIPGFAVMHGDLGPVYGYQWRNWPDGRNSSIDQIAIVVDSIRKNPESRRHIVTAWNPAEIDEMAKSGLPPCHCLFQFDVTDGRLSCQMYQRSADLFLGVPFNIASYALLTTMMAQVCGLKVGEFVHTFGSMHLYQNHLDQARLQLTREPKPLPRVLLNPKITGVFDFKFEDITLVGYDPYARIAAPIAV